MDKSDLTLYEKKGDIYSLGMEFKNTLRSSGIPAMVGGSNNSLNSLGIPVGITLIRNYTEGFNEENSVGGGVVKSDLYDKLLNMCGNTNKKTNSKTKKIRKGKKRRKTRKI